MVESLPGLIVSFTFTGNTSTDTTLVCEETGTKIVKKGCFDDPGSDKTLPLLLTNHRHKINWRKWNEFLDKFSCE
jgi:hypothetical protein